MQAKRFARVIGQALRAEAPLDHDLARNLDRVRIGRVQEQHRRGGAGVEFLLALTPQEIAHRYRHIAEIDVHRAGIQAFVADRAVVGDVGKFVEVLERHAAAGLLFVEKGLDQQRRGQDLVARRVQQVRARHVGRAHRLALAATQAVLDRIGNFADRALLEDQALQFEQVEARRVGIVEVGTGQQLALVETAFRIHALLVARRSCLFPALRDNPAW